MQQCQNIKAGSIRALTFSNRKLASKSEAWDCVKDGYYTMFWKQHWSTTFVEI